MPDTPLSTLELIPSFNSQNNSLGNIAISVVKMKKTRGMEKPINLPKVHKTNKEQKFPLTNHSTDLENHLTNNHLCRVSQYLSVTGQNEKYTDAAFSIYNVTYTVSASLFRDHNDIFLLLFYLVYSLIYSTNVFIITVLNYL